MRIALDYDGVCSDLRFDNRVPGDFDARERYLGNPSHIALSQERGGILGLISCLGLFGDVEILSSRPPDHAAMIWAWLDSRGLSRGVSEVICCGDESKATVVERRNIDILLDDSPEHVDALASVSKGVRWCKESWIEVLAKILKIACIRGVAIPVVRPNFCATSFQLVSDWSASPVMILCDSFGSRLKIRICRDQATKDRITRFLSYTGAQQYSHTAELIAVSGSAVLKSYIHGEPLSCFPKGSRREIVARVGEALSQLHSLAAPECFVAGHSSNVLLVCGADNRNIIVTANGNVTFIDLEACTYGAPWIDLAWSEELLCVDDAERAILFRSYLNSRGLPPPTPCELKKGRLSFLAWLALHLRQGVKAHPENQELRAYLRYIELCQERESVGMREYYLPNSIGV